MISARKKGALLSYVLMFIEVFSSLFFTPFLVRSFGQAEYGVYSLVNSITAYLLLLDMGVGNAIIRYVAKFRANNDSKKQSEFLSVIIVFYASMGVLVLIIGAILHHYIPTIFGTGLSGAEIEKAKVMFVLTALNTAITLSFTPFHKTILAYEHFGFSKMADILRILIRVGVSFLVLWLGGRGIAILTVNLIMTILFSLAMLSYHFFVIKIIPKIGKIDIEFVKEIAVYSGIVFIQMLATQLNKMVDQVIMGITLTSSSVVIGVYAIGAQITSYVESLASGVNGIIMPGVVGFVEKKPKPIEIQHEMARVGRMVFMLLSIVYVVFLFFGYDFITLWVGEDNGQAYYVAAIIMFPMIFHLSQSIGAQILWALNKHKNQAVLQIMVAVCNIFLTYILLRWNPLLGATIATAITYFVGNVVVQNVVFTRILGISMVSYYKELLQGILPCLLLSASAGAVMTLFHLGGWIGFGINCSVMLIVYLIFMLAFGMRKQEKYMVLNLCQKLVGR